MKSTGTKKINGNQQETTEINGNQQKPHENATETNRNLKRNQRKPTGT